MARTKGSKNKRTIQLQQKGFFKRLFSKKLRLTNEDEFISDLTKGYIKWKARGENDYAAAFRVLLNKFSDI